MYTGQASQTRVKTHEMHGEQVQERAPLVETCEGLYNKRSGDQLPASALKSFSS